MGCYIEFHLDERERQRPFYDARLRNEGKKGQKKPPEKYILKSLEDYDGGDDGEERGTEGS